MNKLTAEKCRKVIDGFKWMAAEGPGMSIRDEYDIQAYEIALPILEQQERAEGEWIEWGGGDCPVNSSSRAYVKFRDGEITEDAPIAGSMRWSHIGADWDIIAYRIIDTNQILEVKYE